MLGWKNLLLLSNCHFSNDIYAHGNYFRCRQSGCIEVLLYVADTTTLCYSDDAGDGDVDDDDEILDVVDVVVFDIETLYYTILIIYTKIYS